MEGKKLAYRLALGFPGNEVVIRVGGNQEEKSKGGKIHAELEALGKSDL